ncbi:MAG TPA: dTDP-4-dehydrorhamnose 3,5-epimerase [Pseudolabrys sp.]|nr:dTDP-4-dehydrorhamnose 3,5-epimerase [Pseudolabrys sp.]
MRFQATKISGVFIVESELIRDERGFFARLCCPVEMKAAGIEFEPKQTSISHNSKHGTLRGLHYCTVPEAKLVRCVRGRVFDVAVDLRPNSPSHRQWVGTELDPERANAMYIPSGVAHGFLTLEPDSEVLYQIDRIYVPGFDAGVRWNDPAFAIDWPAQPIVIHPRDEAYPLLE